MFIDSHAHLEMPQFDEDRHQVIERALHYGVEAVITVGTNIEMCKKSISIAEQYNCIYAAVGIHPHDVKDVDNSTFDKLESLAQHQKVLALGEIGLDFYRNLSPKESQINGFREQLQIAKQLKIPVIIHDREAHIETLRLLQEERAWEVGGVIHCFSGDLTMAHKCLDMGFFISIPGSITFKNSARLRNIVMSIPIERILLETDAPFLSPIPFRGKRNEPSYVRYIAEKIAKLKKMDVEEVGNITTRNVKGLFHMDQIG